MCFNVSHVYNINQFCGEIYQFIDSAIPTQEEVDACCNFHRQNDIKCLVTGGCTFVGALLPLLGGWFWIIAGATCGACGNLASYRYTRTTQAQLDHDADVRRLVKNEPQSAQALKEIFGRLNKVEEENALFKAKIAELEKSKSLCENCHKKLKAHVIEIEKPDSVIQLQAIGSKPE